ncbi:MAG: undecaprenyldiphospho-muramoylpentapeptide beta-N-acetylglucosaminyltransferase [Bdellovibrionales bacterium]|nr:undecaprenyldiphospho-muramoylpentapeptide beta-N-acetylglucosaminyltransferase [Bdellovibrionales bacterium]
MRILIAGGGTGGHIYPALSIAKAIIDIDASAVVEFVGTPSGLETQLVPPAGFKIHTIQIGRLNKNVSFGERLKTILQLPIAIFKSFQLILNFKPDVVLGVGGYASGPLVFAAAILRYRTLIWEPNAYPGLANRILSRFVNHALVVFSGAEKYMNCRKITRVHMPVRFEIEDLHIKNIKGQNDGVLESEANNFSNKKFHILVFGGSQGARAINNIVSRAIEVGGAWLESTEIVHQTGAADFETVRRIYDEMPLNKEAVTVLEYLHDMPARYEWANLVIARAGTGTISELAACSKAAILIPLPSAADDHQTKNAQALVDIGGAILIKQKELSVDRLIEEIMALKYQPERLAELEININKFHKPYAAKEIAKIILKRD